MPRRCWSSRRSPPREAPSSCRSSLHSITESHSRDLTHSGSAEHVEPNVLGRTLQVQGGMLVLEERLGAGGGGAVYRARYTESCARFHADASILLARMIATEPSMAMPEIGRSVVHTEGVQLVRAWISGMAGDCSPK